MPLQKKYVNIIYSLITLVCWTGVIFFFAYPSDDPPTEPGLEVYLIYTLFFGLIFGAIILVLRFLKMISDKSNFFYVFPGVLNVCLGLLGIILYLFNALDKMWIELFTISLILGGFIMVEIFLDKKEPTTDVNEA